MFDRIHLDTLAAVVHEGSFEGAARRLSVTPPAVSQRIRALEEKAGVALVLRGPPARATETGRRLVRHAEDLALLDLTLSRDLGGGPQELPRLKIAVNADSLATWFPDAIAGLGGFLFDLVIDDQDYSAEWLRRGEVLGAVSSDGRPLPGCDVHPLGIFRYQATASPGFIRRWFADGITAAALARAPAIQFNHKDRLQRDWAEAFTGQEIALPCHRIGESAAFLELTERGFGWGMNPEPLIKDALAAGRLVRLAPEQPMDVALYWQVARLPGRALLPVTQAIRAAARRALTG